MVYFYLKKRFGFDKIIIMELRDIKGFGEKRIDTLNSEGIYTEYDLLNYLPYKYYDFGRIDAFNANAESAILVKAKAVLEPKCVYLKGLNITTVGFEDITTGTKFSAVWYNQPFMKNNIEVDNLYYILGKTNSKKQLVVQTYFPLSRANEVIMPCYRPIDNISTVVIKKGIKQILDGLQDTHTQDNNLGLMAKAEAYQQIHFPTSVEKIEEAKFRLNVEELLYFVALEKYLLQNRKIKGFGYKSVKKEDFEKLLPFKLTADQNTAIDNVFADLDKPITMNRLVLGDVGSGKTMVAFASMYKCAISGMQSVLLCPTSVLANQHYQNARKILGQFGVVYLHSGISQNERQSILKSIQDGSAKVIIATHSVLSEKVKFSSLSLVVTDEQHRFGVCQRGYLGSTHPLDQIVMSATPIPRSLSLILFGGLDVSEINSRPNGESNIKTNILSSKKVLDMWHFVKSELLNNNKKCFVVVPKIAEDENEVLSSTKSVIKYLIDNNIFNKSEIMEVTGKIDKEVANKTLESFRDDESKKVLVATTVIEVGIDIKSANFMVIYNADRFGLATLHQLRGRVGRDGSSGYCFCISDNVNELAINRLKAFKENNNGLKIAEIDLKLRGAGSLYGTNQHGVEELFSNVTFSVEAFDKAKLLWETLNQTAKEEITKTTLTKYGELYKQIVFN